LIAPPPTPANDVDGDVAVVASPTGTSKGPVPLPGAPSPVALEHRAIPWIKTNLFPAIQNKILEALHHAALTEYPSDRNGMTPHAIKMSKTITDSKSLKKNRLSSNSYDLTTP